MIWKILFIGFILNSKRRFSTICRSNTIDHLESLIDSQMPKQTNVMNVTNTPFFRRNAKEGRDERYDILYNETNNNEILVNISRFIRQMDLLRLLESDRISQQRKLDEIERYNHDNSPSKYTPNIKSGGLFRDWNDE